MKVREKSKIRDAAEFDGTIESLKSLESDERIKAHYIKNGTPLMTDSTGIGDYKVKNGDVFVNINGCLLPMSKQGFEEQYEIIP